MIRSSIRLLAAIAVILALAPAAFAQQDEDDAVLKLAEPDFTLVGLPTALRLARFKSAFRVTHRFTRPLGQGDFGDLAGDMFGLDAGALIGLEYRFGLVKNGQIGIHRTSEKTIAFFGEYGVIRQGAKRPFDVTAVVTIDGTNNFKDSYSPSGAIVSRAFGNPPRKSNRWVSNTNPSRGYVDDNDTFMAGRGACGFAPRSTSSPHSRPGRPATIRACTTAASRLRSAPAATSSS